MGASTVVKPRIAFVSLWDAADPNRESGYAYSMRLQLRQRFNVVDVFPLIPERKLIFQALRLQYKIQGKYYHPMREPSILLNLADQIQRAVKNQAVDLLFSPSSVPLTYVDMGKPIVFATDQVFHSLLDGYLTGAADRFRVLGTAQETTALARAAHVSFPSSWAAAAAIAHHGLAPHKVDVIPWGANLPHAPSDERVEEAIAARPQDCCHIAFIGRDWLRKGGTTVLDTVALLNRRGLPTRLTIIGCAPQLGRADHVAVHPFLDKSQPDHYALFTRIMLSAHFLMLPSRAEAFGQAFCEASAFGVPSVGSTEGGIGTIIRDGVTGFTRPATSDPSVFADVIQATFEDRPRYLAMAHAARADAKQRLNWDSFGAGIERVIHAVLEPQPHPVAA